VSSPTATQAPDPAETVERWSVHGQMTAVDQMHPAFHAAYAGVNSLSSAHSERETVDVTAFMGARLWTGAELYVNPEIDQGFGLSNTVGVAGFPNGEAYKVGRADPYLRWNRAFLRQVFALGAATRSIEPDANQLGGVDPVDNVTLTVGKFSVVDIFDVNSYAHDPRRDFLNWSVIDAGAFDYAADAWGYSEGVAVEVSRGQLTARAGVFALSDVPNSQKLDSAFHEYALIAEAERREDLGGHPGKLKLLAFVNRGRMGDYDTAVADAAAGVAPSTAAVRHFASRGGVSFNAEQEVLSDVGAFLRASANDGSKEAYEFSEINRSVSGGLSLKGEAWHRHDDEVGVAAAVNALSAPARRYFAAGGVGIIIGDGALTHYGTEQILEAYYAAHVATQVTLSADFQKIANPAYNRDRGPVSVFAVRLHVEL